MLYLVVLLLAGCASAQTYTQIDYSSAPAADWPQLRELVYREPASAIPELCRRSPTYSAGATTACSSVNFAEGWCAIFLPAGHRHEAALLEHERAHCRGFDHPGETFTRDTWERHKAQRR